MTVYHPMPGQRTSLRQPLQDATDLSRRAWRACQPCHITVGGDIAFRNRGHDLPYALGKGVVFVHTFTCGDVWTVMVNEDRPDCCACLRKKPASGSGRLQLALRTGIMRQRVGYQRSQWGSVGSPATLLCSLGQVRKEAAGRRRGCRDVAGRAPPICGLIHLSCSHLF